nr:MATE family efflux transporter [Flavobacterium agricola]
MFLYIRMFLIMGITLYTSRIVLEQLGISDYGIYSLVGGVVAMFGFFNAAMSSATQRYLSYDIGRGDKFQLQKTFSATLTLHIGIAILGFVLAETIGLWYVNFKMVVPDDKLFSVNIVYQFSILTFIVGIIQVPYNALIISHEQMKVYAYMSIIEVILKLGAVYILIFFPSYKLIVYSILIFAVSFLISLFYQMYCRKKYEESIFKFEYDKKYYKELISYSGWNLFGNIAWISKNQGVNLIINLFFGTVLNASYAITNQVTTAISLFVSNLQTAFNPQIIKKYSQQDYVGTQNLIFQGSKFSYLLILLLIMPILLNTDYILKLWLNEVPDYTVVFVKLALLNVLIESLSGTLMTGAQATGKIKWYQIIIGTLIFFNLPLAYYFLKLNFSPPVIFKISNIISLIALLCRLIILNKTLKLSYKLYFKNVLLKIAYISCFAVIYYSLYINFFKESISFIRFILDSSFCVLILIILIYLVCFNKAEKKEIGLYIKNKIK